MDLLTQAITQRPPRSPSPGHAGHVMHQGRREERSTTPASTSVPAVASGDARTNARRANLLAQLQSLDTEFAKKKDRYFHEQLRQLQEDLSRLHDGSHVDFNTQVSDLMDVRNEALYIAREEGMSKLQLARDDYEREVTAANEEFESTRATLKNDLLTHLQNKKRKLEHDKTLSDISINATLEAPPSPSMMPLSMLGNFQMNGSSSSSGLIGSHAHPTTTSMTTGNNNNNNVTTTTTGSRKLRHRLPLSTNPSGNLYPPSSLTSKSALDEALESLGDTIKARHWKHNQQPQNEDRVRDRIEREREKLVRSMLIGITQAEADADVLEMKRKFVAKKSNGALKKAKA